MLLSVNGPVVSQLGGKSMDLQFVQLDDHINPGRDVRSGARPADASRRAVRKKIVNRTASPTSVFQFSWRVCPIFLS